MPEDKQLSTRPIELHERRISMPDGRYMVFFTFTDEGGRDLSEGLHGGPAADPTALEPAAAEERNV
jgi:hypothetical protein